MIDSLRLLNISSLDFQIRLNCLQTLGSVDLMCCLRRAACPLPKLSQRVVAFGFINHHVPWVVCRLLPSRALVSWYVVPNNQSLTFPTLSLAC